MSGGPSQGTSTTTQQLSPEQRQLLSQGMPLVNSFVNSYNAGGVKSPSQAPLTTSQIAGENTATNTAEGIGAQGVSDLAKTQHFLSTNVLDPNNNPDLQGYIKAADQGITQNFQNSVIPSLRTEAINAGGLGGSRDTLGENLATQSYLRELGNTNSQILNTAYGQGLSAAGAADTAAPATLQAELTPASTLSAVGAEQQAQQQAINTAQFAQETDPLNFATQLFASLSGLPGGSSTTTTTPARPTSLLGRIFG